MSDSWNALMEACEGLDDETRPRLSAFVADDMLPELFDAGVRLTIVEDAFVDGCGGYFSDEPEPELALAVGNSTWAPTMLHEFSHFHQWQDGAEVWLDGRLPDGTYGADLVEYWYNGYVELNEEQLDKYFEPMLAVEVDCERRTVKLIEDYDLPYDTAKYAREANAYLMQYSENRRRRSWITPGRAPYRVPEILAEMPSDLFTATYTTKPLSEHLQSLFDTCFVDGDPL